MKTLFTLIATWLTISVSFSQSVSPDVIATSGDHFQNTNVSVSWTLGELATETYSAGNVILIQGFQQPITLELTVDLKAFLSGPFNVSDMSTDLNAGGLLPLAQPYNTPPWLYTGTESVASIPNTDVVDWFLVELRDATNAASATPATIIVRQAAFVLKNGTVVGLDGVSNLRFTNTVSQGLFVAIWHRNHIGILSANPLTKTGGVYTYDFTTSDTQVYGGPIGYTEILTGTWGLSGGDGDANGIVENTDKTSVWAPAAGTKGYKSSDFNLSRQTNNPDKNDVWLKNIGKESQVPE